MRVAIYARVSTAAQAEEGYSLGAQVEDCTRYAKAKLQATEIREFVDDGYSGAFLERPALERLRQELEFNAYDAVVCYDADRLARGLTTQLLITEEIEKRCKLYFCNMDYQRTPEGQLFYQIKGAFSGYEREKIKQRSMRGKLAKLKQGKPIQNFRIFGYKYIDETYVADPAEAEIVRLIFSAYLSGEYGGLKGVTKMLNDKGIPSPQGSVWADSSVRNVLTREDYSGVHMANKIAWQKVSAHKITRTQKPQQEWLPIAMPQLVSPADFARAQEKLKKGKLYRICNEPYLVQGLAYCALCGRRMTTTKHGRYVYLRCGDQHFAEKREQACRARVINIKVLDDVFWRVLENVCRSKSSLSSYMKRSPEPVSLDTARLQKELKKISGEKRTLIDWWHSGIVSEADVKSKLKLLTMQEQSLNDQLKKTVPRVPRLTVDEIVRQVKSAPRSFQEKQQIIRRIIDRAVIVRLDKGKRPADVQLQIDLFFR